ncbi:MAG: DNA-binding protein [Thermoproteus sp.]
MSLVFRVPPDVEVMQFLKRALAEAGLKSGFLIGLGSLKTARIAWYDQTNKKYIEKELEGGLEVASLTGNIALKDGEPFLHIHVVLGDREGRAYAGHLVSGISFHLEVMAIQSPRILERRYSEYHGLYIFE